MPSVAQIRVIVRSEIDDFVRGMNQAEDRLRRFQANTDSVSRGLTAMAGASSKAVLGLGAIGNAGAGIAAVTASVSTAAGALLVLPAAGIAAAAAIGTLKLATAGFGEAVTAADPAAFAEATKDMAPAAREGAAAIREFQPALRALKQEVQGAFFAGFAQDVRALGDTYFPVLRPQLVGIAGAYAEMRKQAVGVLVAPAAVADTNAVFGDTRKILDDMRPALGNVLDGILAVAGQGSAEFRGFGLAVTDATERFRTWARTAAESGRITELIREGQAEFRSYGAVAENVGDILTTVFQGITTGTGDLSDSLVETTQALEDFFKSTEGQAALAALGETLQVTAEVTRDVFLAAMRELGPIVVAAAPAVQEFARVLGGLLVEAIQTVGPAIQTFAQFLSDNKDVITVLVPALGALVLGFGALKVITGITSLISGFATALGGMTFLLGPGGLIVLGLAAVAGAFALFADRNREAADAARENQAGIDGLKGSLNQLTGAVTGATTAQIAQGLSGEKLADGTTNMRDAIARAGISFADFTAAATGNVDAVAKVDAQLVAVTKTLPGVRDLFDQNQLKLERAGIGYDQFAEALSRGTGGLDELNAAISASGNAVGLTADEVNTATGELGEVGARFDQLSAQVKEAGEQVRVAAQAGTDFTTTLDAVKAGLVGLGEGAEPTKLLTDNLTALGLSANAAATEAAKAAEAAGANLAGQAQEGARAMQESRDAFLAAADAAGIGAEQANTMANSLGLIPEAKRLEILTNAEGVNAELLLVQQQIAAVPPETTITVNTLSEPAFAKLQELGFEVTRLNDGRVEIQTGANTDPARVAFGELITEVTGTVGVFDLNANPDPATGVITATVTLADGSVGVMTIDANGQPATVELDGVTYRVDSTTGVLTIDGNTNPADAKRLGMKVSVDRTTGVLKVDAATGAADGKIQNLYAKWNGRTINLSVSTAGRLAGGGYVAPRYMSGGGIFGGKPPGAIGAAGGLHVPGYGPGRDTFGPVWLSPGEAVLVPELVRRIGARRIMAENYRFSGRAPTVLGGSGPLGFAGGGVTDRSYLGQLPSTTTSLSPASAPAPAPIVNVGVFVDGQEFRGMVRTEIDADQRATARRVRAGSGASF